jgi:anthranilate synthase component 2
MMLVIDNYDSFTFNLVQAFGAIGARVEVRRNDDVDVEWIRSQAPRALVLSPGPGTPEDAGCCVELVRELHDEIPILGVCLGHQAVAAAFGAATVRAPEPVHGKTADVRHDSTGVFADLPQPLEATRYHSLIVDPDTLPPELLPTAHSADGLLMGLRHSEFPVHGVQFHPESIATPSGRHLLENFCAIAGEPS